MQNLLEILIKEKGLWKDTHVYFYKDGFDIDKKGNVFTMSENGKLIFVNIWHIDTLREIAKAKWNMDWSWHFYQLVITMKSPKEREEYLLSN